MALRFAKVSEEEIKTAFFYPSDLVNTKTTIPLTTIHLPFGDSCILFSELTGKLCFYIVVYRTHLAESTCRC